MVPSDKLLRQALTEIEALGREISRIDRTGALPEVFPDTILINSIRLHLATVEGNADV